MVEADFEVSRIYWLGPLTILGAIAAVLATRSAGLPLVTVPRRFEFLNVGPTVIDTFILVTIAIFGSWLIGYSSHQRGLFGFPVLPLVVSVSFLLIADIDSPRHGLIRVVHQNLMSVSQSFRAQ